MAHNAHPLSSLPLDPYQWHESVLSTRTLSYMSTTDALGSSGGHLPQYTWSRNPTRQSSMTDGSSYDLEMVVAQSRDTPANETVVLPESVADSLLFRLPPELREKVYAYCITAAGNAYVEWPAPVIVGAMGHGMCPELLRTCKAIRDEAGPMLYALNGMAFQHPSDANMFVRAMTSPAYSRCITKLRLHVRAQDTRLWMPYLTSSIDRSRSLKADFPSLRELHVRYISNKWNHALPPEQNMKLWEDAKFEEVINGLRQVFYPPKTEATKPLNEMTAHDFMAYVDRHRPGEDMAFKRQLLELHKAHAPPIPEADGPPPVVRVTCVCQVHSAHFDLAMDTSGSRLGGESQDLLSQGLSRKPSVKEGEQFRGFGLADLRRGGVNKVSEQGLGLVRAARTHFASKKEILVALEIFNVESSRH